MTKKYLLVICSILALFICYKIEQKVYQRQFSYEAYRQKQQAKENITKENSSIIVSNTIQNQILMENQLQKEEKKKVAYLTFDDGPSQNTITILDTLKNYKIKATFFVIAEKITPEREEILKRAIEEGHSIGIHTYSHNSTIYSSVESYLEDFEKAYNKLQKLTENKLKINIYRFPWGSANCYMTNICSDIIERQQKNGFTYYDWNVSAEDSVGEPTSSSILQNIRRDFLKYKEPVILMHDSASNKLTAEVLPEVIEIIQNEGYSFDILQNRTEPCQYPIQKHN